MKYLKCTLGIPAISEGIKVIFKLNILKIAYSADIALPHLGNHRNYRKSVMELLITYFILSQGIM